MDRLKLKMTSQSCQSQERFARQQRLKDHQTEVSPANKNLMSRLGLLENEVYHGLPQKMSVFCGKMIRNDTPDLDSIGFQGGFEKIEKIVRFLWFYDV